MTPRTYVAMTNAGRVSFVAEEISAQDGMMYFKTKGEIVGIVPLSQLNYVARQATVAKGDSGITIAKLPSPASKSRRRRRA